MMWQWRSLVFPLFNVLLNAFNFFFHIAASWYLTEEQYGQANALLALFALLSVLGLSVQLVAAKLVSQNSHNTQNGDGREFPGGALVPALTAAAVFVVLAAAHPLFARFLQVDGGALVLLYVVVSIHIMVSLFRGIMQGREQMLALNVNFYIEVAGKLTVFFVCVRLGLQLWHVMLALAIGMLLAFAHGLIVGGAKPGLLRGSLRGKLFKSLGREWLDTLIMNVFVLFFTSIDMLAVQHYLAADAGIYAIALKYSQLVYFVAFSVITAFVPKLGAKGGDRAALRKLILIFGGFMLGCAGFVYAGSAWLFPKSIPLLFGPDYQVAEHYLPLGGMVYWLLSVVLFFAHLHVLTGRRRFMLWLAAGASVLLLWFGIRHRTPEDFQLAQLAVYGLFAAGFTVDAALGFKRIERGLGMRNIRSNSGETVILLLSWRDVFSPKSGGAEIFTHEMLKRSANRSLRFIHFSPYFPGAKKREEADGVTYLRAGNTFSVIVHAMLYYWRHRKTIDFVVNQCNTHQFFTRFWVTESKRIFFIHQLTREIWLQNLGPLGAIGYVLEPLLLRLARKDRAITVSPSTRNDLVKLGFHPGRIQVIPEGIEFEHWPEQRFLVKQQRPTFLYVGRFVNYKGIDLAMLAFGELKRVYPDAVLWIAGKTNKAYVEKELLPIMKRYGLRSLETDRHQGTAQDTDVFFHGFVSQEKKLELMSRAHALVFPSLREGWGLTVTEAAAVGTPSIVSNTAGLVDATDFGKCGYLTIHGDVHGLASQMQRVIENPDEYEAIRRRAHQYSLQFHFDNTGAVFGKWMDSLTKGARHHEESRHRIYDI
ncbi:glycosyltransferase [Paenibacillus thiaminolyticus]|nr:glycosyltransferase [Paenibacillus thiaminolyticus]